MKTPDNRPKNIYVTSFGFESLEKNEFATVFIDPSLEGDGFGTYIRKDISDENERKSYLQGTIDMTNQFKQFGFFNKEQVVELMNEFAKDCIKILVDTSVQFREGKLTQQEIDVMIDDFTEAWEKRIENL